jgi:zinc D-Ala-D-Ala carboxypeptidase
MQNKLSLLVGLILFFNLVMFSQESVSKAYLTGKFEPKSELTFQAIPMKYIDPEKQKDSTQYLRKEALIAFIKMQDKALEDGVVLTIYSATRNFSTQKVIWESKWKGIKPIDSDSGKKLPKPGSRNDNLSTKQRAESILTFSSMPSTSRHHWGTDFDLNNASPRDWKKTTKGNERYKWLVLHAAEYGFCQPFTNGRESGYYEERWHWSYIPLSKLLTLKYAELISDNDIKNAEFLGAESAVDLNFIENFVLGINPKCK